MSGRLRIVVDGRVVQDRYHGIGRYTLELVRVIARLGEAELLVLHGEARSDRLSVCELDGERATLVPFKGQVASLGEQLRWPLLLRNLSADLLLVPYHLATPWLSPVPVVTVVHDCIIEADPRFAPSTQVRHLYRLATRMALRRASAIVTVSHATRRSVQTFYRLRVPPENVVHHGVDPRFGMRLAEPVRRAAREELALPERYILHVGVRRPHKNHTTLLRAFATLADEVDIDLVLVGDADERFSDPVPALIADLGLDGRVHIVPGVPEALLPAVYQEASIFAFPSLVEGFGLPVLEAMAARVPIVASATPAVAEAAEGAALLVHPTDCAGWSHALRNVLHDRGLAADLRRRGDVVARRRSWDEAGREMLRILAPVAAESRSGAMPTLARREREPATPVRSPVPSDGASVPAIGLGPAMAPKERRLRTAALVAALLLLAASLVARFALGSASGERAPNVLNAAWVMNGTLLRGGQPRDIDFFNMRDVYGVTGIVNFRPASRIERHVVAGFRLDYLWLRLPPGGAPRERQLRRLVSFLRAQKAEGGAVYIHDQGGLEHVPTVTVMLEMLHGKQTLEAVRDTEKATPSERPLFTTPQVTAINALARALSLDVYRPAGYRRSRNVRYAYRNVDHLRW
jgi:glycosyltransferase involved in cell wall biosynthesis